METAFQNKPRRGRPRKYEDSQYEKLPTVAQSRRGKQNGIMTTRAITELVTLGWDMERIGAIPMSVWAELGRVADPRVMAAMAKHIHETGMRRKAAIDMVRRSRLGNREPNHLQLIVALRKTLEQFKRRYPTTTREDMENAFAVAVHNPAFA